LNPIEARHEESLSKQLMLVGKMEILYSERLKSDSLTETEDD
jgi:hypothetical protein